MPLGTSFGVLGVLFAFCQWTLPFPSVESKTPANPATFEAQEILVKQTYDRLSQGKGALIVYKKMRDVGEDLVLWLLEKNGSYERWVREIRANVVERMVCGRSLVAAIFPDLEPGEYILLYGYRANILPGQVVEIDHRGQAVREKKRQSLFSHLRTSSFIIGIGGLLFLAHRFIMTPSLITPYLDPAGIILIGGGISLLIRALFKDL